MRGLTAEAWESFLPAMTVERWGRSFFPNQARVTYLAHGLEQVFGPQGALGPDAKPDLATVRHTSVADAALAATITEYDIPSPRTMVHSVIVDDKSGTVWFSEYDAASNKWVTLAPLPVPMRGTIVQRIGNRIVITTGWYDGGPRATTWVGDLF